MKNSVLLITDSIASNRFHIVYHLSMFEIAQIFPHYLLVEEDGKLTMKPAQFQSEFEKVKDLTALTEQAENGDQ